MSTSTAQRSAGPFDLTVARGAAALARINAAEATYARAVTRQDWKEVGEGLRDGRKTCPEGPRGNLPFAAWCSENGYGKMDASVRSHAMKMVEKWAVLDAVQDSKVHPTHVMAAYRASLPKPPKVEKPTQAPEAAQAAPPPWAQASTTPMDKRTAERGAKTLQRAEYGQEVL